MALVYVEVDGSELSDVSLEALTVGRGLDGPLEAVVVGSVPDAGVAQLREFGVATVRVAQSASLDRYAAAGYAAAVVSALSSSGATVLVGPGSPRSTEVLAHVAARLDTAMAANVVEVQPVVVGSPVTVVRQVMGGSVRETMRVDGPVAVLVVAGHAVEAVPAASAGAGDVVTFAPEVSAADLRATMTRVQAAEGADTSRLAKARVVVGAGRGAGSPDGFGPCIELAGLLGGVLGVSRAVTAAGWRPHHEQVGQTGTKISPELYVPCGISGAIQHWAGCSSAQTILAVNTDDEAPMVTRARYAVIGDMHEVVPAVIEALRARS